MAEYIDGFVLPLRRDRLEEYERVSKACSKIWLEHGALEYRECVGDDLNVEGTRSFRNLAGAAEEETVMFAWAVFPSREVRDQVNEKVMADPRMAELMDPENPIFDCQKLAFGGFQSLVHSAKSDAG